MIRILIADDHAIVRTGLKQIFSLIPDIQIVGETESKPQTLEFLRSHHCDLLLLDLNMPGGSGAELVATLRTRWPDLPILVLTMHNEPQMAASVLRAGANGYITKDCDLDVLLPAVRKVAARGHYLSPGMAEKIVFYETPTAHGAPHLQLTERENQVFQLLTQGLSISDISAMLVVSHKTISTHKIRLLKKLYCNNMADMMRYAIAHNLLQENLPEKFRASPYPG
jgi:DNA-binding NarL/FixJ family response regulator